MYSNQTKNFVHFDSQSCYYFAIITSSKPRTLSLCFFYLLSFILQTILMSRTSQTKPALNIYKIRHILCQISRCNNGISYVKYKKVFGFTFLLFSYKQIISLAYLIIISASRLSCFVWPTATDSAPTPSATPWPASSSRSSATFSTSSIIRVIFIFCDFLYSCSIS